MARATNFDALLYAVFVELILQIREQGTDLTFAHPTGTRADHHVLEGGLLRVIENQPSACATKNAPSTTASNKRAASGSKPVGWV